MSETDEARVSRYEAGADPTPRDEAAQATPGQAWHELLNMTEGVRLRRLGDLLTAAGSVMGLTISRDFQADMAAGWKTRAETAEAEVERLTRECLDREATETDVRERLRRCEERLAAVGDLIMDLGADLSGAQAKVTAVEALADRMDARFDHDYADAIRAALAGAYD